MISESTICAIATSGTGAIAVIRVSGPDTYAIVSKIFRVASGDKKLQDLPANTIHFGSVMEGEEIVDEVLVSLFRAPRSYTGEDVIEISCHGSPYIQQRIMELLVTAGAAPAKPGEFTQRAFMNGKMDLSQAEAVADLIAAESKASHDVAIRQIRGGFSKKIKELRDRLLHFISLIELELDFSEEDVEFADRSELSALVSEVKELVDSLRDSFQLGNVLKAGVPVAIVGRPNVGKSTLLNALLNEERAIVSEIEGTTRDTIEDTVVIEGITFRFIDTAGIRETADTIENLGIRRTYQKIDQASVVMLLVEASDGAELIMESLTAIRKQLEITGAQMDSSDEQLEGSGAQMDSSIKQLEGNGAQMDSSGKQLILVINKSDIGDPNVFDDSLLKPGESVCRISAKNLQNIDGLRKILMDSIQLGSLKHQDVVISNIRHFNALKSSSESLARVMEGLTATLPQDLLAQDIRETLHHLGEITGEVTTDEILGNIFKNFCIGK